jgi:hypothetical protein
MFYILSKDPHKAFSAGCKYIPRWQGGHFSAMPLLIDIVVARKQYDIFNIFSLN